MSPNLLKELEKDKEVEVQLDKTEVIEDVKEEKQEQSIKENILKNTQPLYVPKQQLDEPKEEIKTVNLFSSSAFENTTETERKPLFEPMVEQTEQQPVEEETQVVEQETNIEPVVEEFFEVKAKPKQKNKFSQFRLKLFTAVFCVIMATTTGWVVTNAVRTANLNKSIEISQTKYDDNARKLYKNLEKLKDLDSQNPEDNTSLDIIEEIITLQPLPLENPTDYEKSSNFFDALCNWISGLFGG